MSPLPLPRKGFAVYEAALGVTMPWTLTSPTRNIAEHKSDGPRSLRDIYKQIRLMGKVGRERAFDGLSSLNSSTNEGVFFRV